jgi:hypothetical protein
MNEAVPARLASVPPTDNGAAFAAEGTGSFSALRQLDRLLFGAMTACRAPSSAGRAVPTPFLPPKNFSYQTALDSCATSSTTGLTIGPSTTFTQLRAGSVDGTKWVLWFGGLSNGQPLPAMLGGAGVTAQCMSSAITPSASSSSVAVSELPGRPVAFVIGLITTSSVTSVQVMVQNSLTKIPVPLYLLPGTDDRYTFKEITGLNCSYLSTGGFAASISIYAGNTLVDNSSGGGNISSICVS